MGIMTRDFATDPEVAADLILRARSERDRSRTGEPVYGIVEHWPCAECDTMVGVGELALEVRDKCNSMLASVGQPPIPKRALCDECKRAHDEARAAARRPHEQTEMPLGRRNA